MYKSFFVEIPDNRGSDGEMKKENEKNQYQGMKRPSVVFTEEEHKIIAHYCIDNNLKVGDFIKRAALHCAKNKVKIDGK